MLKRPLVGLSLMLEDDFLRAALPLFEAGEVDVLEWSFDVGWVLPALPAWADELLDHYSRAGRLLGHGVTFSALSAAWTSRQAVWLDRLRGELARHNYLHVSEHFGFMTAGDFHQSAPLPVPLTDASLRLGQERLRMLQEQGARPVGLENLAFAFGRRDVADQGRFLGELLRPVDGFLLLDLHNLYCQSCNFGMSIGELLDLYPLNRVRELHVSGGSWSKVNSTESKGSEGRAGDHVRRDTHDGPVPDEVFAAVPQALARCPNTTAVILERLGGTLALPTEEAALRDDYRRLRRVVESAPAMSDDANLAHFQATLLDLLDRGLSPPEIVRELQSDLRLAEYAPYVATFEPRMVEIAIELIAKWGRHNGGNLVKTSSGG